MFLNEEKKGFLPEDKLLLFAEKQIYLLNLREFRDDEFTSIILTKTIFKKTLTAVFKKTNGNLLFITFYGPTSWITSETADFSGFQLDTESEIERKERIELANKRMFNRPFKKIEHFYFFAYDSLKKDFENHKIIASSKFLGYGVSKKRLLLYKSNPILMDVNVPDSKQINGEIYLLKNSKKTRNLDALYEGKAQRQAVDVVLKNGDIIHCVTYFSQDKKVLLKEASISEF